jgi:predicted 3-demethylubiquinone-9 3-methyltransferase (glyoxalase superfamily)
MNNSIYPCLWFDNNAAAAAEFYKSVFEDVEIHNCTPMVVTFQIKGKQFMGLNGGPQFKPNPSVSFFAICRTEKEIDEAWNKLSEEGMVMMPLSHYPWSEKYGFIQDKYNVSWQLSLAKPDEEPTVFPSLMFTGAQNGQAEKAINFYTSLFKNSDTEIIAKYEAGEQDVEGNLKYGQFKLDGQRFSAMDSSIAHPFTFNEGVSLVVNCDTQEEIDFYWLNLSNGGKESMCGWCQDSFGVWWQIVPSILGSLMTDPAKAGKVGAALMKMNKLDIAGLIEAGNN